MDSELVKMFINILLILPFIVFLIYISLKYGGTGLQKLQNGRLIRILERVPISKENSILVVKIGSKSYVITSTNHSIEILKELDESEELKLLESKTNLKLGGIKDIYSNFTRKGR